MPGPGRSDPTKRHRTNTYVGEKTLKVPGPAEPARELPQYGDVVWTVEIENWWRAVWTSPMAWEFHPDTDFIPLVRLAVLGRNALYGDVRAAAEARQLEDRYGLNSLARNKLGWTLPAGWELVGLELHGPEGGQPADDEPAEPEFDPTVDPRVHLRAVAGGKA